MDNKFNGLIVFLGAKDLEQTDKFYAGILGLKLYKDQGVCKIYDIPGGGCLGFCTHVPVTRAEKSPIITLLSEDVDGLYQDLAKTEFAPALPPVINPNFNIYHFFVIDPNGYWVEIQRFLD